MRISKLAIGLIVLLACMAFIHIARFQHYRWGTMTLEQVDPARSQGDPEAPIKIVAFADFQCELCANANAAIKFYQNLYPEKIYLEYRYFPMGMIHRHAFTSAYYAECAGRQKQFWPFHDLLFSQQKQWRALDRVDTVFDQMAWQLKLDLAQLKSCVQDSVTHQVVLNDRMGGQHLGVKVMPTVFINGQKIVGNPGLQQALQEAVKGVQ